MLALARRLWQPQGSTHRCGHVGDIAHAEADGKHPPPSQARRGSSVSTSEAAPELEYQAGFQICEQEAGHSWQLVGGHEVTLLLINSIAVCLTMASALQLRL